MGVVGSIERNPKVERRRREKLAHLKSPEKGNRRNQICSNILSLISTISHDFGLHVNHGVIFEQRLRSNRFDHDLNRALHTLELLHLLLALKGIPPVRLCRDPESRRCYRREIFNRDGYCTSFWPQDALPSTNE